MINWQLSCQGHRRWFRSLPILTLCRPPMPGGFSAPTSVVANAWAVPPNRMNISNDNFKIFEIQLLFIVSRVYNKIYILFWGCRVILFHCMQRQLSYNIIKLLKDYIFFAGSYAISKKHHSIVSSVKNISLLTDFRNKCLTLQKFIKR